MDGKLIPLDDFLIAVARNFEGFEEVEDSSDLIDIFTCVTDLIQKKLSE
jgi:hypothetical protein